ncbi:phosphate:acyl-[acyl carrier protein] acyltransferase [Thermomonospora echinospora]|uniref:Phosphate acyltransferase n=1 Tax=Thermomonospora echinospora TaxID=1992 RepID=A0A1H5ZXG4_9ACTN|nr:phosphate acyltransferase PlsX [Thermomonospora echinospora]SEG40156.1 phosphate:acyl-[acyl carrier protein] acyltransferase [Thermomonospora echinospora]
MVPELTGRKEAGQPGRPKTDEARTVPGKRREENARWPGLSDKESGGAVLGECREEDARARPVVLDAMGGDHGPAETVRGAVTARREYGVPVLLVGRAPEVHRELLRHDAAGEIEMVHAADVVRMAERGSGAAARRESSLMVGCELVRRGAGAAFVSAGSTGAVVTCAVRVLGRELGVLRPALAVAVPSVTGGATVLVDAGATTDPTPEMVARFALLGAGYARRVLGVADPLVGLLSVGAEPGKGNRLARRAAGLLPRLPVRFHGNIEGHDVLAGTVDVVVTDGFTGNVVLKSVEGCVRATLALVADAGVAAPDRLREVARRYAAETHGGAALLGLAGTVVVAHGSSRSTAIARACVVARDLAAGRPAGACPPVGPVP